MADETMLHEVRSHLVASASLVDNLLRDSPSVSPQLAADFANASRIFTDRAERLLTHIGRQYADDHRVPEATVEALRTAVARVRDLHGVLVELPVALDPSRYREPRPDYAPPWRDPR